MKPVCQITHPQIMSGICPWCKGVVSDNEVVPTTVDTIWNIPAMSLALSAPEDDVRSITVTNLDRDGLTTDLVLPLFSKALNDKSDHVRTVAQHSLSLRGGRMTLSEAQQFEAKAPGAESELAIRTLLLGYYFLRQHESESAGAARHEHIYWIITNAPDSNSAGPAFASIHGKKVEQAYETAKELWLEQVKSHPENPRVLGNAAAFFVLKDWKLCEDLLGRASRLEPNNSEWPERLGQLYSLHSRQESPIRQINIEKAFRERQIAAQLQSTTDGATDEMAEISKIKRFFALPDLAKSAFEAGHFEEAHQYATEMLELVARSSKSEHIFPTGNAVHHGNLVLGRLALRSGDVEEAKARLRAAGHTAGSPQLDSFGPNMMLAKELLEHGERDVVVEYFELCQRFWKGHHEQLDAWTNQVKAGHVPNFGPNLVY